MPCESTLKNFINFTSQTSGFNSDKLKKLVREANLKIFPMVWSVTAILESHGCIIRLILSDSISPNRRFYRLHGDKGTLVYKTPNIYTSDQWDIFFIADAPNLIKTTRITWKISMVITIQEICM